MNAELGLSVGSLFSVSNDYGVFVKFPSSSMKGNIKKASDVVAIQKGSSINATELIIMPEIACPSCLCFFTKEAIPRPRPIDASSADTGHMMPTATVTIDSISEAVASLPFLIFDSVFRFGTGLE